MKRKYFNRMMGLALVGAMTMGMLGGCGSDSSEKGTEGKGGDQTITVAASAGWIRDIDRELAAKFEEETGIKVDIQANPDDQYEKVLMTRLSSGEGPDIYMGELGIGLERFQPDTYALDLSNEAWVDKYPDWMVDQASYDGKVVGFTTWGRDFRAMLYNKDLFKKYNIEVPTDYASFKKACETLLDNGITPVYFPGKEEWYCDQAFDGAVNIETKDPGTYEKLNNNETTYAESEEAVKFLENLNDSAQSGYFGENYLADTFDQGQTALASGKYAMWFGWATYVNDIEAAGGPTADSWGAFPCPYADDFSTVAMTGAGMTRMINKDSKNIDACKQYFDFLAKEENLQAFYDERTDLLETTMEGATATAPSCFTDIMKSVDNKTEFSPKVVIKYQTADGSFGKNIQSMFFGQMTPEQVLQSLDSARTNMFETVESDK